MLTIQQSVLAEPIDEFTQTVEEQVKWIDAK